MKKSIHKGYLKPFSRHTGILAGDVVDMDLDSMVALFSEVSADLGHKVDDDDTLQKIREKIQQAYLLKQKPSFWDKVKRLFGIESRVEKLSNILDFNRVSTTLNKVRKVWGVVDSKLDSVELLLETYATLAEAMMEFPDKDVKRIVKVDKDLVEVEVDTSLIKPEKVLKAETVIAQELQNLYTQVSKAFKGIEEMRKREIEYKTQLHIEEVRKHGKGSV